MSEKKRYLAPGLGKSLSRLSSHRRFARFDFSSPYKVAKLWPCRFARHVGLSTDVALPDSCLGAGITLAGVDSAGPFCDMMMQS